MLHTYRVKFLTEAGHVNEDVSITTNYVELIASHWVVTRALSAHKRYSKTPCAPLSITLLSIKDIKDDLRYGGVLTEDMFRAAFENIYMHIEDTVLIDWEMTLS